MTTWSEEEDEEDSINERENIIRGRNNVASRQAQEVNLSSRNGSEDSETSGTESDLKGLRGRGRALRVASESWDSDFEFQLSSTSSLCLPSTNNNDSNPRLLRHLSSSTTSSTSTTSLSTKKTFTTPLASPKKKKTWLSSPSRLPIPIPTLPLPSSKMFTSPSIESLSSAYSVENETGRKEMRSSTPGLSSTESKTGNEDEGLETEMEWDGESATGGFALEKLPIDIKGKGKELKRENSRKEKERKGKMLPPPLPSLESSSKKWKTSASSPSIAIPPTSRTNSGRRVGDREILVSPNQATQFVVLGRRSRASSPEGYDYSFSHNPSPSKKTIRNYNSSSSIINQSQSSSRSVSVDSVKSSAMPIDLSKWKEEDETTEGESNTEGEFSDLDDPITSARLHYPRGDPFSLDSSTPTTSFAESTLSKQTISKWDRWRGNGSQVSFVDHDLDKSGRSESIGDLGLVVEEDLGTVRRASSRKLRRKRGDTTTSGRESNLESEGFTTDTQESANESGRRRSFGIDCSNRTITGKRNSTSRQHIHNTAEEASLNPALSTSSQISSTNRSDSKKSDIIVAKTTTEKKAKRLSLTNLMSRSTSALPLSSSKDSLPLPTTIQNRPSISTRSVSATNSGSFPHSSSTTSLTTKLPRSESFISRARIFSRTKTAPVSQIQESKLDENWKMPRNLSPSAPPQSILRPLPTSTATQTSFTRSKPKPPPTTLSLDASFTSRPSAPSKRHSSGPSRPKWSTHKPSFSLSSLGLNLFSSSSSLSKDLQSSVATSPTRPQTALDRPTSFLFVVDDLGLTSDGERMRRNSLSDLRIPSRITSSQARIEEDLERVKEFAKGIDDLKRLRQQYHTLLQQSSTPPSSPNLDSTIINSSPSFPSPPLEAVQRMTQAIKRLEIDYHAWWEQADALVNLGDGRSTVEKKKKDSPALSSSKRDRCTSLAPPESPSRLISLIGTGEETETEELVIGRKNQITRKASNSSVETGYSIEVRQKEMLRCVLSKASTLPNRSPPTVRPPLSIIAPSMNRLQTTPNSKLSSLLQSPVVVDHPTSPTSPAIKKKKMRAGSGSKKSGGVLGIKDFLLRLKSKGTVNENSNTISAVTATKPTNQSLQPPTQYSNSTLSRRSVSNPDKRSTTPPPSTFRPHSHSRNNSLDPTTPTSRNGKTPTGTSRILPFSSIPLVDQTYQKMKEGSSSSEEDWDSPPRVSTSKFEGAESPAKSKGLEMRRSLTVNEISSGEGEVMNSRSRSRGGERMVLTTEAMPKLLLKVREVHLRCEECIHRLKAITI